MSIAEQIASVIPNPNAQTTRDWIILAMAPTSDETPEEQQTQMDNMVRTFAYISNQFHPETAQQIYDLGGILPADQIMAAICLECGFAPEDVREMATCGKFECCPPVQEDWGQGRLAIYSFAVNGEIRHTLSFLHDSTDLHANMSAAQRVWQDPMSNGQDVFYALPEHLETGNLNEMVRRCGAFACHVRWDQSIGDVAVTEGVGGRHAAERMQAPEAASQCL